MASGVSAVLHHQGIPKISNIVLAFEGPTLDTAAPYASSIFIDVICVVGRFTVAQRNLGFPRNPPELELWAEGEMPSVPFFPD